MQLQAGLIKIGIGVSLLVGCSMPAIAEVSPTNDNLLCAAYMDVMLEDMTPLGLIPKDRIRFMLINRHVQMSALSLANGETPRDVVSAFIKARDKVRKDESAAAGMNEMRLFTPSQVEAYSIKLANNGKNHCVKANKHLEYLMKTYTKNDFLAEVEVISSEMTKQGEQ